jgi:hypothetical protein
VPRLGLSLTVPRYTNRRACYINGLQEVIHVSRLPFFTQSCTRSFFVSSLKERRYIYSMYLSTVKVGLGGQPWTPAKTLPPGCDGLCVRRMAVWWTFREPSLCRHGRRALLRNALRDFRDRLTA